MLSNGEVEINLSTSLLILAMNYFKALKRYFPPSILAGSLFVIYLQTMATGLTWAHHGADGGDLIAAAATGGVPHPTGYPLYLLLARVFQLVPVGTLAYRTNLMSAVATVMASVLVYALVTRFLAQAEIAPKWLPGMIAGYAFGLAPVVWSQAVITEVYALLAFFVALILFLSTHPRPSSSPVQKHLDRLRGAVLGLAMGNHITVLLLVPVVLALSTLRKPRPGEEGSRASRGWVSGYRLNWASARWQLIWMGVGLLVYLILPLRAMKHPAINWGNPVTLKRFWWLVSGELYQTHYLQFSLSGIWNRVQALVSLFLPQFGILGLLVGLVGLIVFFQPSRRYFLTIWIGVSFSIFAMSYRTEDSYLYLIPVFLSFSIWIGLGIGNLLSEFRNRFHGLGVGFSLLFLLSIGILAFMHWPDVDVSHDHRAEDFGLQVLETVPDDAIIFAKGDRAIFTMWYFHYALEQRPDLIILAEGLLKYDWYQETMRAQYPSLVLVNGISWSGRIASDNSIRPACYVEYNGTTHIRCEESKE